MIRSEIDHGRLSGEHRESAAARAGVMSRFMKKRPSLSLLDKNLGQARSYSMTVQISYVILISTLVKISSELDKHSPQYLRFNKISISADPS